MTKRVVNYILLVIVGFLPIAVGVKHGVAVGGLAIFSLGVAYLLFNLDRFKQVKAGLGGIEAELRETIKEAKDVLAATKKVAIMAAKTELSLTVRSGRIGGYDEREKEERKNAVLSSLQQLQVDAEEVGDILLEANKFTIFDYAMSILGNHIPNEFPKDKIAQWKELRHLDLDNPASPEQLREFFTSIGKLNDEVEEIIQDYEHYLERKEHRRFEVWENHQEWWKLWH